MIRPAIVLALLLPLVVAPDAGSAPEAGLAGAPVPQCSPGPASCAGWYTGNVTVSWTYDPVGVTQTVGCNVKTVTTDGVTSSSCEVWYGDSSFARTVTVRRDATPPQVTGSSFERGADAEGWYNRPVTVTFAGSDATSGIGACDRPTYGGPDGASATVSGTCRDVAGNASAPSTVALKFDATPPAAAASAERPAGREGLVPASGHREVHRQRRRLGSRVLHAGGALCGSRPEGRLARGHLPRLRRGTSPPSRG